MKKKIEEKPKVIYVKKKRGWFGKIFFGIIGIIGFASSVLTVVTFLSQNPDETKTVLRKVKELLFSQEEIMSPKKDLGVPQLNALSSSALSSVISSLSDSANSISSAEVQKSEVSSVLSSSADNSDDDIKARNKKQS